jgi:MIP family channel proteins
MLQDDNGSGNMTRTAIAELIGTFILVFAGTAVASAAALNLPIAGAALNSLAVGLAFGLALAALVYALGHVSGAHVNPAVTIGLAAIGKFPWAYVPAYIIAQIIGAILAAGAVWATFGNRAREKAALGATFPTAGTSDWQAFLMEFLITFILVFVIIAVATDERAHAVGAAIAIGFALGVAVLIGGPVSGGAVNPARALGPMIVSGKFTGMWIYIIAPILGGIAAAWLYSLVMEKASAPKPVPVVAQRPPGRRR